MTGEDSRCNSSDSCTASCDLSSKHFDSFCAMNCSRSACLASKCYSVGVQKQLKHSRTFPPAYAAPHQQPLMPLSSYSFCYGSHSSLQVTNFLKASVSKLLSRLPSYACRCPVGCSTRSTTDAVVCPSCAHYSAVRIVEEVMLSRWATARQNSKQMIARAEGVEVLD